MSATVDKADAWDAIAAKNAEIARLHKRIAELEADGWRDIETAPEDGTRVILAWQAVEVAGGPLVWFQSIGCWDAKFDSDWDIDVGDLVYRPAWTDGTVSSWAYEDCTELHPTHWRPLPAPPSRSHKDEQNG